MHTHACASTCTHSCVHTPVHPCPRMRLCVHTCSHVCVDMCLTTYAHAYTHVHMYTQLTNAHAHTHIPPSSHRPRASSPRAEQTTGFQLSLLPAPRRLLCGSRPGRGTSGFSLQQREHRHSTYSPRRTACGFGEAELPTGPLSHFIGTGWKIQGHPSLALLGSNLPSGLSPGDTYTPRLWKPPLPQQACTGHSGPPAQTAGSSSHWCSLHHPRFPSLRTRVLEVRVSTLCPKGNKNTEILS